VGRDALGAPFVAEETIPTVVHHLRRVNAIFGLLVQEFEVMETMTPQGFLDFREKLVPASGFQSFQLREIEVLLGLGDSDRVRYGNVDPLRHIVESARPTPGGALAQQRLTAARAERTLLDCLDDWLYRTPIHGSSPDDEEDDSVVQAFVDEYLARMSHHQAEALARLVGTLEVSDPTAMTQRFEQIHAAARAFLHATDVEEEQRLRRRRIRAAALFIESYRELPLLSWPRLLLDTVVELEARLVLFRSRHARMVERMIGRRVGTGGSGGVDYLDRTTEYRVFRDLWAVRTVLLPKGEVPPLRNPGYYGFSSR
jgi:tryptophan 2,3-dioxygenase